LRRELGGAQRIAGTIAGGVVAEASRPRAGLGDRGELVRSRGVIIGLRHPADDFRRAIAGRVIGPGERAIGARGRFQAMARRIGESLAIGGRHRVGDRGQCLALVLGKYFLDERLRTWWKTVRPHVPHRVDQVRITSMLCFYKIDHGRIALRQKIFQRTSA
jgi:hypothetical protein